MDAEIGHFCLILALCIAALQFVMSLLGAKLSNVAFMRVGRYAAIAQTLLVAASLFVLPNMHHTSALLWLFILSLWMTAVALFSKRLPVEFMAYMQAVLSTIAVVAYVYILMLLDSFHYLVAGVLPSYGAVIHLSILYMGYVGFSVVFAFSVAALMHGRLDAVWVRWVRPWAVTAWVFLTLGVVVDGQWFNHPILSASLLPWLVATALLHALPATEKRGVFKAWSVLLSIVTFGLCVLAIVAPALATNKQHALLIVILLFFGLVLFLSAFRSDRLISHTGFSVYSREMMLLLNNALLIMIMLVTFCDMMGWFNPAYFNLAFLLLILPLLVLIGIGPYFKWQHTSLFRVTYRLVFGMIAAVLLAVTVLLVFGFSFKPWAIVGLSLGFWIWIQTVNHWLHFGRDKLLTVKRLSRSEWAMVLGHSGVAIVVMGVTMMMQFGLFARWIGVGGILMTLAGMMILFDRRYRVKRKSMLPHAHEYLENHNVHIDR
ncbi:MAG: cytochrome c-type biogenesis CcmF C-terminal domain-containing protein [Coxiellaceae bacterium]|nr:cytochrome c-type biogenesis CcmF C-terminal domain-containing protein [Coxiellaceae bacterium]